MAVEEELPSWFTYIVGGLVTAILTVTGTVVALAKYINTKNETVQAELKGKIVVLEQHVQKCEEDRVQLGIRVAKLEAQQLPKN